MNSTVPSGQAVTSCAAAWLDQEILATRQDDWRGNLVKERAVRYAVQNHVPDEAEAERIDELPRGKPRGIRPDEIEVGRIWLNLELAKKSARCLEYIVVHEMVHLLERHHNDRFRALMNRFLPQWQLVREELNRESLAHEDWDY